MTQVRDHVAWMAAAIIFGLLAVFTCSPPARAQTTYTSCERLALPTPFDPAVTNVWGTLVNTNTSLIDEAYGDTVSIDVSGASNVVLTATNGATDQARHAHFIFTGTLTGNIVVLWPQSGCGSFSVYNNTSGSFTLDAGVDDGASAAAGTTIEVPQSGRLLLISDGTNVNRRVSLHGLSPLTTKGDLMVHNGTTSVRIGVGSDGEVLTADSSATEGVAWSAGGGGGGSVTSVATGAGLSGGPITGTGTIVATANTLTRAIPFLIDGGGATITTGVKGDLQVPFSCTIQGATLLADQSGSIAIDIWKDSYANYPPTIADSIVSASPPTITTAVKAVDTTLTGWTTGITAGDTLRFNVNSATTIQRVTLILECLQS